MKFNIAKFHYDFIKVRREKGIKEGRIISNKEIYKELGISKVTFYRCFNGEKPPSLKTLGSICRWMGKTLDEYIDLKG